MARMQVLSVGAAVLKHWLIMAVGLAVIGYFVYKMLNAYTGF